MTARKDLPSVDVMARNVLAVLARATTDDVDSGTEWYPIARDVAEDIAATYGLPIDVAAGVLAVLSAGTEWTANVAAAYAVCEEWRATGDVDSVHDIAATIPSAAAGNNVRRAARMLSTGTTDDVARTARTLKVHSFWLSILGDVDSPCIDRHATRVALGDVHGMEDRPSTDAAYREIAAAYRKAAAQAGMTPRDAQAISWITCKRERDAARAATVWQAF